MDDQLVLSTQEKHNQQLLVILEKVLFDNELSLEKMNGALDFQLRLQEMESKKAFNKAMVGAIGEIPSFAKKGKVDAQLRGGGKLKYEYAKFEHINEAVKPILMKHGLFVSFSHDFDTKNFINVTATITHELGFVRTSSMLLPLDTSGNKGGVHAVASTISYGKRYAQNSLLNISTHGEDDDGIDAMNDFQPLPDDYIEKLHDGIEVSGIGFDKFVKYMGVKEIHELSMNDFDKGFNFLQGIINEKGSSND